MFRLMVGGWRLCLRRSLTGYDNHDAVSGQPDGRFCFSCSRGWWVGVGVRVVQPHGRAPPGLQAGAAGRPRRTKRIHRSLAQPQVARAVSRAGATQFYQSRYLSNGGRLFFDSTDALVAQDTNNTEDVYEYEPPAGARRASAHDTCTVASSTFTRPPVVVSI